nr:integrase, catalytic region, zinc finger, CCHC-type, peptidase aspartic, catalytic [Tanacetum cinerariifolium]
MFDEYFNPTTIAVSLVPVAAAPRAVDLADSPMSTSIDQDTLSTSISSTQDQEHSLIMSKGFEESPKTPHFHDDLLYESLHEDSTSQGSSSNMRPIHTPFESLGRWTKDNPIANNSTLYVRKYCVSDFSSYACSELGNELTYLIGSELGSELTSLADVRCAGSDTRPPMLDMTDFASWQQRIRLYCRGKENGVNILKLIDEGPFRMGTLRETLTEGALHLWPERPRVYSDLTSEEKDRYNADIRATNILLQGLPKDIYSLINHYTDAKDIWDNVKMLLKGSKLTKEDHESQQYDDFEHVRQHKGETIHDYYVWVDRIEDIGTIHEVQVQLVMRELRTELGMLIQVKQGILSATTVMENGVALDEEPLLFIADPVYDETGPSYDSDILSEVHDHDHYQDVFCKYHEVHEMHDDYVKDNAVQVVQSNVSAVPNDVYMMILNDMHEPPVQHVSVTTQNKKENKYLEEFLDMKALKEKVDDKLFKQDQFLQIVHMLYKPKPYYNEQSMVAIGYKSPLCLSRAKQVQPALYNGYEIIKTDHVSAIVHNSEDTLEIAEITRKKMNEKMKTPLWT